MLTQVLADVLAADAGVASAKSAHSTTDVARKRGRDSDTGASRDYAPAISLAPAQLEIQSGAD
jgi:hypothetical protein